MGWFMIVLPTNPIPLISRPPASMVPMCFFEVPLLPVSLLVRWRPGAGSHRHRWWWLLLTFLFLCFFVRLFVCLMIHYHNNYYVMYILFMVLLMFVLLLHVIRFFSNCYKNVMVYKNGSPMSPPTNVNVASGTNNWGLRLNLPKPPLWRSASMGDQQEDGWRYSLIWPCPPGVRKIMKHLEIFWGGLFSEQANKQHMYIEWFEN